MASSNGICVVDKHDPHVRLTGLPLATCCREDAAHMLMHDLISGSDVVTVHKGTAGRWTTTQTRPAARVIEGITSNLQTQHAFSLTARDNDSSIVQQFRVDEGRRLDRLGRAVPVAAHTTQLDDVNPLTNLAVNNGTIIGNTTGDSMACVDFRASLVNHTHIDGHQVCMAASNEEGRIAVLARRTGGDPTRPPRLYIVSEATLRSGRLREPRAFPRWAGRTLSMVHSMLMSGDHLLLVGRTGTGPTDTAEVFLMDTQRDVYVHLARPKDGRGRPLLDPSLFVVSAAIDRRGVYACWRFGCTSLWESDAVLDGLGDAPPGGDAPSVPCVVFVNGRAPDGTEVLQLHHTGQEPAAIIKQEGDLKLFRIAGPLTPDGEEEDEEEEDEDDGLAARLGGVVRLAG